MTSVQFNPPWGVPERNAREDLLPRFRANPAAMQARGFRLFGMQDGQRVEVEPDHAWTGPASSRTASPTSSGRMRATATRSGRIKFVMPNDDASTCTTRPTAACSAGPTAPSPPAASGWRTRRRCSASRWRERGWDGARIERAIAEPADAVASPMRRPFPVRLHYTHGGGGGRAGAGAPRHLRARRGLCRGRWTAGCGWPPRGRRGDGRVQRRARPRERGVPCCAGAAARAAWR